MVMEKNSKTSEVLKAAGSFITTFITAFVVIAAIAAAAGRIYGCQLLTVQSGSMSPSYPVNSLIVTIPADFEDIEVGDVISYVLDESGTIVTHRVVEKNYADRTFVTKGDANDDEDANPVYFENVVGKVFLCIPGLGGVLEKITSENNRTKVIAVIVIVLACSIGWDIYSGIKGRRKGEDDGETEGENGGAEEFGEVEDRTDPEASDQ